ncbi:MAG: amylo-alpha-1,6-glucosidase [Bacteroides sp.]
MKRKTGYIFWEKEDLVNLSQSLNAEFLSTNHSGGYMCSTTVLCNTRKYHGLMVLPLEQFGGERYVLLSNLDETLVVADHDFHLSTRKYSDIYYPKGHKYLEYFSLAPTPTFCYRVGNLLLRKELLFAEKQDQLMVRYTMLEGGDTVKLLIYPLLAYRNAHALTVANLDLNTNYTALRDGGVLFKLYAEFPELVFHANQPAEYVHAPDWNRGIYYTQEASRGYPSTEDLWMPGTFELELSPEKPVILSVSTLRTLGKDLDRKFDKELASRPPRIDFETTLKAAAGQFIAHRGRSIWINAGYPWFGRWGRDTMISLPGLTLSFKDYESFRTIFTGLLREAKDGLLPNMGGINNSSYNSIDAPLWAMYALHLFYLQDFDAFKDFYSKAKIGGFMRDVLELFSQSNHKSNGISIDENGIIWTGTQSTALTWMDAVVAGIPVTSRAGAAVELNALWYNAVCFFLELMERLGQKKIVGKYSWIRDGLKEHFSQTFYSEQLGYLADYIDESGAHFEIRPNMLYAVSLPYSPLTLEQQRSVVKIAKQHLYTPVGMHTLSPRNPKYKGQYVGDQTERDLAYHQGTIWPWLLDSYVEALAKVSDKETLLHTCKEILSALEREMHIYGLGTIGEVFDGDPPHTPGGSIAQAWSVAAAVRILQRVETLETPIKKRKGGKQE